MNYELAKKLKDAGFPQVFDETSPIAITEHGLTYYDEHTNAVLSEIGGYISVPTLSALIEGCGDGFKVLLRLSYEPPSGMRYKAGDVTTDGKTLQMLHLNSGQGKTPEEAVANLWLALNTHE